MNKKVLKGIFLTFGLLTVVVCLVLGGMFIGYANGKYSDQDVSELKNFFQIFSLVKDSYVDKVDTQALVKGAIKGMLGTLDDPHSVYLAKEEYNEMKIQTEGHFSGVGIAIDVKDKKLMVVSPIEGTPAYKAGMKAGDTIIKIDGKPTGDITVDKAVSQIRGPIGTQVILTVQREGEKNPIDYKLVRQQINMKSVSFKKLPDTNIGYISIIEFREKTGEEFRDAIAQLQKQGVKGVILDLRFNPGGLLDAAIDVGQELIPNGKAIVHIVDRDGSKKTYSASKIRQPRFPLVVLVNEGSASASEIVSGAIKDNKVGVLVGIKTYGKGSVQTIFPFGDGTALKLTIAKYLTPSGISIHKKGIEPDYKVEIKYDESKKDKNAEKKEFKDTQLDKAIEVLKGMMKNTKQKDAA